MRTYISGAVLIALVLVMAIAITADAKKPKKGKFEFPPVTADDWTLPEDSTGEQHDAIMLLERMELDDTKLDKEKVFATIHRRLRVLTPEGRSWGDVNIPVFHSDQKVLEIQGRTVGPNGSINELTEDQIFEKVVLKAEGVKIKQFSFSLPGLSDDCIVEYYYKVRLPESISKWTFQNEIKLVHGELLWKLYQLKLGHSPGIFFWLAAGTITPNYLLDPVIDVEVERLPSLKEVNELKFTVNDVPAFKSEPKSLPEDYLKGSVHVYYASSGSPVAFWGSLADRTSSMFARVIGNTKRVKKLVPLFDSLETDEAKCKAAYRWLQDSIANISYDCPGCNYEKREREYSSIDKSLKNRIASSRVINTIYWDLLREMDIEAHIAWVVDRDEKMLMQEAKYWQFDRSLVVIPQKDGSMTCCSPGQVMMPYGRVSWFNEGVKALVCGGQGEHFRTVPASKCADNTIARSLNLTIDEEFEVTGKFQERITGQRARSIRLKAYRNAEAEHSDIARKYLEDAFPDAEFGEFTFRDLGTPEKSLLMECDVSFPGLGDNLVGDRLIFSPFSLLEVFDKPFSSEDRKDVIVYSYPFQVTQSLTLNLPEGWAIEALPGNASHTTHVGESVANFHNFGTSVSLQSAFKLHYPFYGVGDYVQLCELYDVHNELSRLTLSLIETE